MRFRMSDYYYLTIFCVMCEKVLVSKEVHKSEVNITGQRERCPTCGAFMVESLDPVYKVED